MWSFSWLPRIIRAPRSRSRSTASADSGPKPTTSPATTISWTPRASMSASTARSACMLPWTSEMTAIVWGTPYGSTDTDWWWCVATRQSYWPRGERHTLDIKHTGALTLAQTPVTIDENDVREAEVGSAATRVALGLGHPVGDRDPSGSYLDLPVEATCRGRAGRGAVDFDQLPGLAEDGVGGRPARPGWRDRHEQRSVLEARSAAAVQQRGPSDAALRDVRRRQEPDHRVRRRRLRRQLEPRRAGRRADAGQPPADGRRQPAVGKPPAPALRRGDQAHRLTLPHGTVPANVLAHSVPRGNVRAEGQLARRRGRAERPEGEHPAAGGRRPARRERRDAPAARDRQGDVERRAAGAAGRSS